MSLVSPWFLPLMVDAASDSKRFYGSLEKGEKALKAGLLQGIKGIAGLLLTVLCSQDIEALT